MGKKSIIIGLISIVAIIGVVIVVSQFKTKNTILAGDSELVIKGNGTVYCTKYNAYLTDFENNNLKAKIIFFGEGNFCYVVNDKKDVYRFDLDGDIFYTKKTYENEKYWDISKEYSGYEIVFEKVSGGYTQSSSFDTITKQYDFSSNKVKDLI